MEISNILTSNYDRQNFQLLLNSIFGGSFRAVAKPEKLDIDNKSVETALKLGEITLSDRNTLAVYEVELQENVHVSQNRVTIRNLLRTFWNKYDGAFIANHKTVDADWRFSFVSETRQWNADGTRYEKAVTDAKRYTYLLGKNETARTAKERFMSLQLKSKIITLNDVKEAFSVETLSDAFFIEYKQHYIRFCNHLLSNDSYRITMFKADDKAIRDFCKKLLGRIVFLYFLQKKGWLGAKDLRYRDGDKNFISNLFHKYSHGDLFYSGCLTELFFETLNKPRENDDFIMPDSETVKIPFLNGGLFEKETNKYDLIDFSKDLFIDLFTCLNQYNFTIYEDDPNDHTVAVDPEMLGQIFEKLLEDNKSKGTFYTPKEIVHYMCQESLIEYLSTWFEKKGYKVIENKVLGSEQAELFPVNEYRKQLVLTDGDSKQIDRVLIEKLLKKQLCEDDTDLVTQHAEEFHKALDSVKICDPAIGSGAFPMGLLQEIFAAKQLLHHFQHGSLEGFKAAEVKLNIIQNSIYGVDIEKGAVDIARLRFWLSLVIDEDTPKLLPNLDYKIVVGNSLVSEFKGEVLNIDWGLQKINGHMKSLQANLALLAKRQKAFIQTDDSNEKMNLKVGIRKLKIEILINQLSYNKDAYLNENPKTTSMYELKPADHKRNLEIDLALAGFDNTLNKLEYLKNHPDKQLNFFDWKLNFPEVMNPILTAVNGRTTGFDIILGNPPYVSAPTMVATNSAVRNAIIESGRFATLYQKWDLYVPFMELGLQLLDENGIFAMIVPYPLTNQVYAKNLRNLIVSQFNMFEIVDLNGTKIFDSATVSNCIPFIQKSQPTESCFVSFINEQKQITRSFIQPFVNMVQDEKTEVWNLTQEKREAIRHSKMNILGDFCYISKGMVLNADEKKAKGEFAKDDLISDTQDDIHCRKYIEAKDIERYGIKRVRYLEYNTARCPNKLSRPTFRELYNCQKLMFNRLGTLMVYLDDETQFLHSDSMFSGILWHNLADVTNKSISSSVTRYSRYSRKEMEQYSESIDLKYLLGILNSKCASMLLSNLRGGDYHIYPEHLRNLPIPLANKKQQQSIIDLVDEILKAKKENINTAELEREIDKLVYELYGLTESEIATIEK